MSDVAQALKSIVGEAYFSDGPEEAYFYSRDPGLMPPHKPDYVVIPETVEEIQQIVKIAGREKIPLVPMGAGMALTGLVIPLKGGIVIDMKRMNRVLQVNEGGRHAIVEGGTSQGALKAYLLVVTYNGSRFDLPMLRARLEQVEGMPERWELVMVADGSTDGSIAFVEKWSSEDPRVRLIVLARKHRPADPDAKG